LAQGQWGKPGTKYASSAEWETVKGNIMKVGLWAKFIGDSNTTFLTSKTLTESASKLLEIKVFLFLFFDFCYSFK
jgi:hypothetical protein